MTHLSLFLAIGSLLFVATTTPALGEATGESHSKVTLGESNIEGTSISNITVQISDPGSVLSNGYTPAVTSLGRPETPAPVLNPYNVNLGGEEKKSSTTEVKFGVSVGGKDGLMTSNVGSGDIVESVTLPDGTTIKNPRKENGLPLTKAEFANLARGNPKSIGLSNGTTLGTPSCPQGG